MEKTIVSNINYRLSNRVEPNVIMPEFQPIIEQFKFDRFLAPLIMTCKLFCLMLEDEPHFMFD